MKKDRAKTNKKIGSPPGTPWEPLGPLGKNLIKKKLIFLKNSIFPKIDQNQIFIMFLDDLEAGIGISIQKKKISWLKTFF